MICKRSQYHFPHLDMWEYELTDPARKHQRPSLLTPRTNTTQVTSTSNSNSMKLLIKHLKILTIGNTVWIFFFFLIQTSLFKPGDAYSSNTLLHLSQASRTKNSNPSSPAAIPSYFSIHGKQNYTSLTAMDPL